MGQVTWIRGLVAAGLDGHDPLPGRSRIFRGLLALVLVVVAVAGTAVALLTLPLLVLAGVAVRASRMLPVALSAWVSGAPGEPDGEAAA